MGTSQGAPGVVSNGQRGGGDLTSGSGVSKVNCSEVGAGEGELSLASGGTSVGINFISRNQFKITKSTANKIFDPLEGIFVLLGRKGVDNATRVKLYNPLFRMVIPFLTQPPHERTLTGRGSRVYPNGRGSR